MLDLFANMPKDLQQNRLREFEQFQIERSGELDLEAMTLSKRETLIARHETPPARTRAMDSAEFTRHYNGFDRRAPPKSDEMTLLLALVKVNAAEAYGVSRAYQSVLARALKNDDKCELRLLVEEQYHTRILLSCANLYGIEVKEAYQPPSVIRVLIGGMTTLPHSFAHPLSLAGEIFGTIVFARLLHAARRVLKDAPEIRDAMEERILEIWADERSHISFHRLTMGAVGLAQTRMALPLFNMSMKRAMPEAFAAGAIPDDLFSELPMITDVKRLPAEVRRDAFIC